MQLFKDIRDAATLQAMKKVDRKLFVPENMQSYAYEDSALPIGLGQTISQPYIVAYMTAAIQADTCSKVLEVGTGSGYQTAILAELAREVYTIEIIPQLAIKAKNLLDELGYTNIHYKTADAYYGWEEAAPFDAILVTAAIREIPPNLLEQLGPQGKMILPLGAPDQTQYLVLAEKEQDRIQYTRKLAVRFVPFTGKGLQSK